MISKNLWVCLRFLDVQGTTAYFKMRFSVKFLDIRIFASGFLKVLEEQKVKSTQDLERLVGRQFGVEK